MLGSLALENSRYHRTGQLFSDQEINMQFGYSPTK